MQKIQSKKGKLASKELQKNIFLTSEIITFVIHRCEKDFEFWVSKGTETKWVDISNEYHESQYPLVVVN